MHAVCFSCSHISITRLVSPVYCPRYVECYVVKLWVRHMMCWKSRNVGSMERAWRFCGGLVLLTSPEVYAGLVLRCGKD